MLYKSNKLKSPPARGRTPNPGTVKFSLPQWQWQVGEPAFPSASSLTRPAHLRTQRGRSSGKKRMSEGKPVYTCRAGEAWWALGILAEVGPCLCGGANKVPAEAAQLWTTEGREASANALSRSQTGPGLANHLWDFLTNSNAALSSRTFWFQHVPRSPGSGSPGYPT